MFGQLLLGLVALALVVSVVVVLWAWRVSVLKRRRLVAAYDSDPTDRRALNELHTRKRVEWPAPPPLPSRPSISDAVGGAGGAGGWRRQATVRRDTPVEPLRPAYSSRATDPGYSSPMQFGEPVSLFSTGFDASSGSGGMSTNAPFEGGGGSFGGAGASGGWDAPGDNGGGYSGDSGDSGGSGGGDCGGSSSD